MLFRSPQNPKTPLQQMQYLVNKTINGQTWRYLIVTIVEPKKGRFDDDDVWGDEPENVSIHNLNQPLDAVNRMSD